MVTYSSRGGISGEYFMTDHLGGSNWSRQETCAESHEVQSLDNVIKKKRGENG